MVPKWQVGVMIWSRAVVRSPMKQNNRIYMMSSGLLLLSGRIKCWANGMRRAGIVSTRRPGHSMINAKSNEYCG